MRFIQVDRTRVAHASSELRPDLIIDWVAGLIEAQLHEAGHRGGPRFPLDFSIAVTSPREFLIMTTPEMSS